MRTAARVLLGVSLTFLFPAIASASLVTFDIQGQVDDGPTAPGMSAVLTVDTAVIGDETDAPIDGLGITTFTDLYSIDQPGTGLSVTFEGQTYFAHDPLTISLSTDSLNIWCGSPPIPVCDTIAITSDLGSIFLAADPLIDSSLTEPTLSAMATESLVGFRSHGAPDDTFVLDAPGRQQVLGNTQSITRVPEPPIGLMFAMSLACVPLLAACRKGPSRARHACSKA